MSSDALLVELLAVIVADEEAAVRRIQAAPGIVHAQFTKERFVEALGHQIYKGDTALHVAAAALRPRVVSALIQAGADPNAGNRRGAIALHYACDPRPAARASGSAGQTSVLALLLDAGSDIERRDKAGATPLHRAVRARSPEAVRALLARGARADAPHGRQRTTPLHMATHSTGASGTRGTRVEQQRIVELLLQYGADPHTLDTNGHPPRL